MADDPEVTREEAFVAEIAARWPKMAARARVAAKGGGIACHTEAHELAREIQRLKRWKADKVPFSRPTSWSIWPWSLRGQRLVLRDMLQRAHDEIERLNDENEALRIDLAAAYCRMDDMEGLNDE